MTVPYSHLDSPAALLFSERIPTRLSETELRSHRMVRSGLERNRARIGLGLADACSVPAEPVGIRVAPIAVKGSACRAFAFLFESSKGLFGCGTVGPLVRFCALFFFCSVRAGSWAGVIFGFLDSVSWW